eukprot:CAMPEP_0197902166 /NCGR_PEP_ID=MMETSP1439-20131203/52747_1 /TAXON_ID=66791 /ORGANISM="Gonyaulax spinifera, Strain CCMP409" /LENGTH=193 /DNA_ID=CAMNT_0043523171 /DNA_START=59 /DNA_END=640 /DNA_ORIENTATION=-
MGSSSRNWLGRDCATLGRLTQDTVDRRPQDVGQRRRQFWTPPSIVQESEADFGGAEHLASFMDNGPVGHEGGICFASFEEPATDRHHLPCMVAAVDDSLDKFVQDVLELGGPREGGEAEANKSPEGGDFMSVVANMEAAPQPVDLSSRKAARRLPSCWITSKPSMKRSDWQVPKLKITSRLTQAVMKPKTAWM